MDIYIMKAYSKHFKCGLDSDFMGFYSYFQSGRLHCPEKLSLSLLQLCPPPSQPPPAPYTHNMKLFWTKVDMKLGERE